MGVTHAALMIGLCMLAGGVPGGAPPRLSLQLSPRLMGGVSDIRATVRVVQDPCNRVLSLSWISDSGGAGESIRELEGDQAPITHIFYLRDQLPANYSFVAALFDCRGKLVARVTEEIIKP